MTHKTLYQYNKIAYKKLQLYCMLYWCFIDHYMKINMYNYLQERKYAL